MKYLTGIIITSIISIIITYFFNFVLFTLFTNSILICIVTGFFAGYATIVQDDDDYFGIIIFIFYIIMLVMFVINGISIRFPFLTDSTTWLK